MTPTIAPVVRRDRGRHGADGLVLQRIERVLRRRRFASRRSLRASTGTAGAPSRRPAAARRRRRLPRGIDRAIEIVDDIEQVGENLAASALDVLRDLAPQAQARLLELARRLPVLRDVLLRDAILLGELLFELLDVGRLRRPVGDGAPPSSPRAHHRRSTTFTGISCSLSDIYLTEGRCPRTPPTLSLAASPAAPPPLSYGETSPKRLRREQPFALQITRGRRRWRGPGLEGEVEACRRRIRSSRSRRARADRTGSHRSADRGLPSG